MHSIIAGTGGYLPEYILTNAELEMMVDTSDEWITKRTGIKRRHIAKAESVVDLGYRASLMALANAGIEPGNLDFVIANTSTPDMLFPAVSCCLAERLGAVNASCFDVYAACTGFLTALDIADGYIASGKARNILVCSSEKLSALTDYTDRATCVLFGDGSGAFVLKSGERKHLLSSYLAARGSGAEYLYCKPGGYMFMDGREVYKFAVRAMPEAIEHALERAGLEIGDIDWIIPHQANARIIDSVVERFNLPREKVLMCLEETGNFSSASIPYIFNAKTREGGFSEGDKVLMVAFGAGLTFGALIYEV